MNPLSSIFIRTVSLLIVAAAAGQALGQGDKLLAVIQFAIFFLLAGLCIVADEKMLRLERPIEDFSRGEGPKP